MFDLKMERGFTLIELMVVLAVIALGNAPLTLGPDPIIGPQAVVLQRAGSSTPPLRVATDGLRPFAVSSAEAAQ